MSAALLVNFNIPASQAPAESMHWYRCNTHTHTNARPPSDANESPEFVADWYRSHGYQCLVITDHEFVTDVEPLNKKADPDRPFLVLRGQEITQTIVDPSRPTGFRQLHVNGLNVSTPIMPLGYPDDPRNISPSHAYIKNIDAIRAIGGIPQVNHPNLQWSVRLNDLLPITGTFLLEIWNAFPTSNNLGGVDGAQNVSLSSEALWDGLLSNGKIVWGVASDDAHEYHKFDDPESPSPGKAWIVLRSSALTVPAITEALCRGQFYASTGITLEEIAVDDKGVSIGIARGTEWSAALTPSSRYVTHFVGQHGRVLAKVAGMSPRYDFTGNEQYVRASITDSDGRRAWTQPVFRGGRVASARAAATATNCGAAP